MVGGYCFNDSFSYEEPAYQTLLRFVESGSDPILFFTLGSCSAKDGHRFCQMLLESCRKLGFRLLIGSGWSQTGIQLQTNDRLFLMPQPQPQSLAFGGKNSSVGKSILRNSSQGLSPEVTHSLSGMQKSNAGMSICTFRTICTMVNRPIVTYTVFFCSTVSNAPP